MQWNNETAKERKSEREANLASGRSELAEASPDSPGAETGERERERGRASLCGFSPTVLTLIGPLVAAGVAD